GSRWAGGMGTVSAANSHVGSGLGDLAGASVAGLSDNNYVVSSPGYNANVGAATWANGASGATFDGQNTIDAQNSILGPAAGSGPSVIVQKGPLAGSFFASFPLDAGGAFRVGFTNPNQITYALAQGPSLHLPPRS